MKWSFGRLPCLLVLCSVCLWPLLEAQDDDCPSGEDCFCSRRLRYVATYGDKATYLVKRGIYAIDVGRLGKQVATCGFRY